MSETSFLTIKHARETDLLTLSSASTQRFFSFVAEPEKQLSSVHKNITTKTIHRKYVQNKF